LATAKTTFRSGQRVRRDGCVSSSQTEGADQSQRKFAVSHTQCALVEVAPPPPPPRGGVFFFFFFFGGGGAGIIKMFFVFCFVADIAKIASEQTHL